ncbi:hypothetical protein EDB89DRAFT_2068488 [Lactarius sanguifluus]|nr:hypothetical protein EDB89DRAFT_2068488 [Lactarius sanguifluus]
MLADVLHLHAELTRDPPVCSTTLSPPRDTRTGARGTEITIAEFRAPLSPLMRKFFAEDLCLERARQFIVRGEGYDIQEDA